MYIHTLVHRRKGNEEVELAVKTLAELEEFCGRPEFTSAIQTSVSLHVDDSQKFSSIWYLAPDAALKQKL